MNMNFAVVLPLANEEHEFQPFFGHLAEALKPYPEARAYLVLDRVSKDRTMELCRVFTAQHTQFIIVFEPDNRNVVDAYIRGYREALSQGHDFIIEMDAGYSHDPAAIPQFLNAFADGYACVFGSRFIRGGSMRDASLKRRFLSRGGTALANLLLGTRLHDMTSGYQGFTKEVVTKFSDHPLRSTAHFYQTELRYLLRYYNSKEIPITYKTPSPSVRAGAVLNSLGTLWYYFAKRATGKSISL
ncbi:MAG: glycosyltransferase [Bacteroidales bacterium]|nr:glycosyltransferase [Bacteroidales bacterium]